jgi:hypothetical protein
MLYVFLSTGRRDKGANFGGYDTVSIINISKLTKHPKRS